MVLLLILFFERYDSQHSLFTSPEDLIGCAPCCDIFIDSRTSSP